MALSFKSPPLVTQEVIDQAAKTLGVTFPLDYAEFLLKTNGGVPKPRTLMVDAGDYKVDRLYSIYAIAPKKGSAIFSDMVGMSLSFRNDGDTDEMELRDGFLTIGLVDELDFLVLAVKGDAIGTVSVWPEEVSAFGPKFTPLASSFTEFLNSLEQPSEAALARAALRKQYDKLDTAISDRKWLKAKQLVEQLDLSIWEPSGTHPVFYAIETRDLEKVQQLHAIGVSFEIDDGWGRSPLQVAEGELTTLIKCLEDARSRGSAASISIISKWEQQVAAARPVLAFLQEHQIK